jgi:hypothetical protein
VDEGLVLKSLASDDFNAIDPNIVFDSAGTPWLSFGSFWTGIKMRRLDATTGKLSAQDGKLYALASRERPENPPPAPPGLPADWQAIEAPFIVHHGDPYYLFVSFDLCCRGVKSNYRTMVGRSREVTGPYVDSDGKPMLHGGGGALLTGNARWFGPGGESILQQPAGDIIVFHAYDPKTGYPFLQISTIDLVQRLAPRRARRRCVHGEITVNPHAQGQRTKQKSPSFPGGSAGRMGLCCLLSESFSYDRGLPMPAAAVSAASAAYCAAAANCSAADCFVCSTAAEAAAHCATTSKSATVRASTASVEATAVEPAPKSTSAEAAAEPRACTDEQPSGEVARTVVTVGSAGIRVIPIVSVRADRSWAHVARTDAHADRDALGISVRR